MILTSNFKIAGHLPQAVAISLGVPRGWRGARCTVLAPPRPLIKIMDPETFIPLYKAQVLDKLDPHKIIKDLGGDNFIMLCWEDPGVFCHRRVVAAWMQKQTGVLVEEFDLKLRRHLIGSGEMQERTGVHVNKRPEASGGRRPGPPGFPGGSTPPHPLHRPKRGLTMSFIGSINAETRKWLGNNGPAFDGRQVYVGCSGNFTVEQLISRYAPKARIWGNDVSLYSGALGAYLADQPFNLTVREEDYQWLEAFMEDGEGKAATVMVLLEALKYEKANKPFKARHWDHYRQNFSQFHQATVEKLRERKQGVRLQGYTSKDIFDLLDEIPKDGVVIAFLPTYAGGYERMFKRLGEIFAWDEPNYEMIDEERKKRTIMKMMERDYLYLDDRQYPGLPMVAVVRKARMKPVYIYSNMAALRLAVLKQQRRSQFVPFARLSDQDEITPGSKLTIAPTTNAIVNYFRDVYLSKGVGIPADGEAPFAVAVDGKVFGFLIFARMQGRGDVYLLADFVVDSTRYSRLAKLLLLVIQSKEIRRMMEEHLLDELPTCRTMVFTDKPVSMKYRGLFKLARRDPGKLVYETDLGIRGLEEVIPLWLKKYQKS